eukprot:maker-scaffold_9-snap-gene-5.11-mRNA-1 protein AED:0.02 eAED:0.02 QI:60/1/1/1/1/1/2/75/398
MTSVLRKKGIMVAATMEHTGKTTTCLALMSGLRRRLGPNVGFLKPVGQKQLPVIDEQTNKKIKVDKDVKLFKEHFNLINSSYSDMSPVKIPPGYTRKFLDGGISELEQIKAIQKSFYNLSEKNDYIVVEGTGHCGVGSIVKLDNAKGANILGLDMVLVVNGGLGSAFDELSMNRLFCLQNNVKIRGVIVNKVREDKIDMIKEYFAKALKRHGWDFPLLGVVPDFEYLGRPTIVDYENLFGSKVLSEKNPENNLWHFDSMELVSMGLDHFCERFSFNDVNRQLLRNKTLYITHGSRSDVILGFLAQKKMMKEMLQKENKLKWKAALLLTGSEEKYYPKGALLQAIKKQDQPVLLSKRNTFDTLMALNSHTAKLNEKDVNRTNAAIEHYEKHINFDLLLS